MWEHMKNRFFVIELTVVLTIIFWGCGKRFLPVPEYPLTASDVEAVLEEVELPWEISKEESWQEQHTVYTLQDEEGRMIAIISSAGNETERYLNLSFFPSRYDAYGIMRSLTKEEWEPVMKLGTLLYGGFQNVNQLCKEYAEQNTEDIRVKEQREESEGVTNTYEEVTIWEHEFREIVCTIKTGKPDAALQQNDLTQITFYNSPTYAKEDKKV